MRLLLDTHVLLWWMTGDRKLPRSFAQQIEDPENEVAVSAASFWEIAIKESLGRIDVDLEELIAATAADGFEQVPVTGTHAVAVGTLPDHHRDPFDRLLIAQAIVEQRAILSRDQSVMQYEDVPGLRFLHE